MILMHSLLMANAVADITKRSQNEPNRHGVFSIREILKSVTIRDSDNYA